MEKRGRFGRKNAKGFYDYPQTGPKRLWPGLADLQKTKLDPDTIDAAEALKARLLAIQALETARCFEEGVLTDVREADVGSILGFGYAPYSGGTLVLHRHDGYEGIRRAVRDAQRQVRRSLQAEQAARRDGAKGRELLHALRPQAAEAGGVPSTLMVRSRAQRGVLNHAATEELGLSFETRAPLRSSEFYCRMGSSVLIHVLLRGGGVRSRDRLREGPQAVPRWRLSARSLWRAVGSCLSRSEGAFDDPSSRLRLEGAEGLRSGDDLDRPLAGVSERVEQLLPPVHAICEHVAQSREPSCDDLGVAARRRDCLAHWRRARAPRAASRRYR